MTDCSKPPRCADERNPSSAKNRVTVAIPSVWIMDGNTKHQTCHLRGGALQELTKISRCFCHWSEREMRALQRKDSNLLQPSGEEEPRILEQLSQNLSSIDLPCLRSLQPESSEITSVTSDGHHLKNVQEATAKCRGTLQSCCKATVTPGCNIANFAECVPKTCVTTLHSRAPSLPREAGKRRSTPRRAGKWQKPLIRGADRGPNSELVVLFSLRTSGCGCRSQDVPAGRHTILCSQQKQTALERVETEIHMTLETFTCNFAKSRRI